MKKIIEFIIKYKIIFISILILLYGFLLRVYIPFHMPIHENNHGIFFMNNLYKSGFDFSFILEQSIFIKERFIENMNYGLIPKLLYGYIVNNLGFGYNTIFYLQILFNVLTVLFLSISAYLITGKKLLFYSLLILGIILPYNIKFASTDEFFIIGNFFISVSLFFYILFLKKEKYLYFYFSIFLYITALYTRNLYLILGIFYIILFLYFITVRKYNYKKIFFHYFLVIIIFFIFTISRFKVFLFTKDKFSNGANSDIFTNFSGFFTSGLTPLFIIILIFLGIILPIFYFLYKKIEYKKIVIYYVSIFILYILLVLLISTSDNLLLQERLQNLFVPFFILLGGIGLYLLINYLRFRLFLLLILLLTPFFYIKDIKNIYSPQADYLFIENNINKLGNNYNLLILGAVGGEVFNNFPEFLIINDNYKIYSIDGKDHRYDSFIDNYQKIKKQDNYFILSYDCYRGNNIGKYMRKECELIENNFLLETISEKFIENKPYIFGNNSNEDRLRIGIYKIISKKDVEDNTQN